MSIKELTPSWQCLGRTGTSLTRGGFIVEVDLGGYGWSEEIPDSLLNDPYYPMALMRKFEQMYAKAMDLLGFEVDYNVLH